MTVEDLYGVPPEDFLARRKELAAAAKKRGDADAAKSIGAARRPTTAAWVVNLLVRTDDTAMARLNDLGEDLRAAHAAMDGPRIRELTGMQRKVIDGLVRAGLAAAGYADPPTALRNDVTDTLQAAIADPDVAGRLGRLEKAERWSGFGEFGTVPAVGPVSKTKPEESDPSVDREAELAAAKERQSTAASDAETAKAAHTDAVEYASERKATLAKARRHYEKLLESVDAAEQALNAADEQFEAAERATHDAAARLNAATSEFDIAGAELARLTAKPPVP